LAGVSIPPTVQGRSLLPIIRGEAGGKKDIAVSSDSLIGQKLPGLVRVTSCIRVTSKRWALLASPVGSGVKSELYDLSRDPKEQKNLIDEQPEVAEDLRLKMIRFLRSLGTKEEILRRWMKDES